MYISRVLEELDEFVKMFWTITNLLTLIVEVYVLSSEIVKQRSCAEVIHGIVKHHGFPKHCV